MHDFVSFKFEIVGASDARLAASSQAALYGKGRFTTIGVDDAEPFLWEKHWKRLTENSGRLGLDISDFSPANVLGALNKLIETNKLVTGRARITFFDERSAPKWPSESDRISSILITTGDSYAFSNDLRLTISSFTINSRSPLAGIKSCNYLENLAALDDARKRGFYEAVRRNELGEIASACSTNLFWLKN